VPPVGAPTSEATCRLPSVALPLHRLLEPGAAGRVELLTDLAEALRETGDFERAESALAEVIESASTAGDRVLEARAVVIAFVCGC